MIAQTQFKFETLKAEITAEGAVIRQDFLQESTSIAHLMLWGAAGGFVLLTALGNIPFAIFWSAFLLGIHWFIKRHSDERIEVTIDKAKQSVLCKTRQSGTTREDQFSLAEFTHVLLCWTTDRRDNGSTMTDTELRRYRLCLFRPMSQAQSDAELPDQLAAAAGTSDIAAKLIRATARNAGISYVEITSGDLRSHEKTRALGEALQDMLAPDYELIFEEKFKPSLFSKIH